MADRFAAYLELRHRALDDGLELVGWTFDPLEIQVAHLSIARLGAVVERFLPERHVMVAEWWIRRPHVERRLCADGVMTVRAREVAEAPVLTRESGGLAAAARRAWVELPLTANEPWRAFIEATLVDAFARGYRVVDVTRDEPRGVGRYLLAKREA